MALMAFIGIYFNKRARNSGSSFLTADGSIGWSVNSFAILATIMSGGGMMGSIGLAAGQGINYVAISTWGTCLGTGLAAFIIAPPLRKSKARSLSDFYGIRYENRVVSFLVATVIAVAYTVYLVSQMKASGTVSEYVMGIPYVPGMIICWIVFTLYTVVGGMFAVTWNDFIQGVLMMTVVILCAVTALTVNHGYTNMMEDAYALYSDIGTFHLPLSSYIGFFCVWFFTSMCAPSVMMRLAAAKNPFSAGMSMQTAMLLLAIFTFTTLMITGPAARIAVGADVPENADSYLLLFAERNFSPLINGIIGAGVFAAIMSTAAGLLLAAAGAFSNDIICKLKKFTPKGEARVAIASCFIIAIVVLSLSFNPPEFLVILYGRAMNFLMVSLFAPFFFGIWWKRATAKGAIAGILAGAISFSVIVFGIKTMPTFSENLIALPLSIIFTIVVSLSTAPQSAEKAREIESWHTAEGEASV
jgi:SSS family transporter